MSQNVEVIQNAFGAFERGDIQTILDHCTSDCEFRCPGPAAIPYAGTKKGHAEIRSYFDLLFSTQSEADLSIDEFVAQGDVVVAIGRYTARVTSTGKTFDSPVVLTFHLRDGKITRHMVVSDTAAVAASYVGSTAAASLT